MKHFRIVKCMPGDCHELSEGIQTILNGNKEIN